MYCKYCGRIIDEDSIFCQFCGGMQAKSVHSAKESVIGQTININGNIDISNNKTFFNRIISCLLKHKGVYLTYAVWFLLNIILLICGSDRKGFFPRIFKDYKWWHGYTMPTTRSGYEDYSWSIKFKIENYAWVEFVVYIALIPLLIYIGCILYGKYKQKKQNKL